MIKDHKFILRQLFQEIIEAPVYDEKAIRQYFDQGYIQEVDNQKLDFEKFCQHIKAQKKLVQSTRVEFKTLIEKDAVVFSNHLVHVRTNDGQHSQIHVMAEFHFKNGKVIYCDELTRLISGGEAYRDLGSVR